MRKFRNMAVMLAALLLLVTVGCSKSAAQRVKSASDNLGKASSFEAKLTFALNMSVTQNNASMPAAINVSADITYFKDPMGLKVIASAALPDKGQTTYQVYAESVAQNMLKMYLNDGKKWTSQSVSASTYTAVLQNKAIDFMGLFKSVKVVGTEEINGVKTDKIDCVLDEEKVWNAIMTASGAGMLLSQNQQSQQMVQLIKSAIKGFTIQYWVAQNEDRIVQMKIDLTQIMQMILALSKSSFGIMINGLDGSGTQNSVPSDVSLSMCYIQITFDKLNNATPIQIPSEARTAVQN